jgi:hypothetical protein
MSTTSVAITCVTSVLIVFILACWSLAYFRGWRVIAPASNGKRVGGTDAAPATAEGSPVAGAVPIRDGRGRFAGRRSEAERAS